MVCTKSARLAAEMRDMNQQDMRDNDRMRYNYKLSDLAAGLAVSQINRLLSMIERRCALAKRYSLALEAATHLELQHAVQESEPIFYRYVVLSSDTEAVMKSLQASGIMGDRPVFLPLHRYLDMPDGDYPNSTTVWNNAVSIPLYPSLTTAEEEKIVAYLRRWADSRTL